MSETDDIFDMDHFFDEKKAPAYIKKAWNKHLRYFNECEKYADLYFKVVGALRTIKAAVHKI
jgi:hypothetical protein